MEHLQCSLLPPSLPEPPPLINQKRNGRDAAYGATGRAWSGLSVCFPTPLNHWSQTASINTWLPHRQAWCDAMMPKCLYKGGNDQRPIMSLPLDTGNFHPRYSDEESHSGTATLDFLQCFLEARSGRTFSFHPSRNQEADASPLLAQSVNKKRKLQLRSPSSSNPTCNYWWWGGTGGGGVLACSPPAGVLKVPK